MCGIVGIFGEGEDAALAERMNQSLVHRGPDDEGIYSSANATLAMRRLAIIDLLTGEQPITNEDRTLWIVFNGEIYNHRELRKELKSEGHLFRTRTDTEVILHLFEEKGTDTPRFLRGDFAFAIWDERQKRGFLARDHLGVKPLYYAFIGESLLFASELKALLQDHRLSLKVNPEALDLYLTLLYVPSPLTIYDGIFKLPPGASLEYHQGKARIVSYWKPPTRQIEARPADLKKHIYSRLKDAVAVRLMSDVPLGAFLSGGIDSTAIVALMSQCSSSPVKTFSIGYGKEFSGFNELEHSRFVANHFGTEHCEFVIEPDIRETIMKVADVLDEPFGDSSAIPTYLVSQQTAGEVKVALSGIGGDELFGGYPRYLGTLWETHYRSVPLGLRKCLSRLTLRIPERESSRNIGGWIRDFLSEPEQAPFDRYRSWISFHSHADRQALYTPEFRSCLEGNSWDRSYFQKLVEPVDDWHPTDQALYVDLVSYLVNDLLFMADQMGMANSLEIRVPFCDHLLAEDLLGWPWQWKVSHFRLKKLLKTALKKELPPRILRRKKQGFMIPVGSWMRNELRPLFEEYLDPVRLRRQCIFDAQQVNDVFQAHLSGKAHKSNQLWSLFVFQLWYEKMKGRLSW